ncbi:dnaD domain protein [Clostridium sp. CAG:343]|nr:dnaD domain protein [Clostridium sp. CAG:343]
MRYALDQEEIELTGISKAIFSLVKPQLDANYKKYENGKQKKSKTEAKQKQTKSKKVTNVNENENVNDNVNVNDNDKVSDSCVDGLQKIIDFYNENIGLITPYGVEVLEDYSKDMPTDLIIYAMQISVEANKRTIKYIKAILNNWQKAGIRTLVQAKDENHKKKNESKEIEEWLNE